MNTYEIEKTLLRDRFVKPLFLGVFACDQLPEVDTGPCCFVANTDPSDKPGEHWVAMFFDKQIEYFDSYGLEPQKEFDKYNVTVVNKYCLQDIGSVVCGEYCCYFLLRRCRGVPFGLITSQLKKRVNSDNFVKRAINKACCLWTSGQYCTCRK